MSLCLKIFKKWIETESTFFYLTDISNISIDWTIIGLFPNPLKQLFKQHLAALSSLFWFYILHIDCMFWSPSIFNPKLNHTENNIKSLAK